MLVKLTVMLFILLLLFFYMFGRMVHGSLAKENGTYKPKMLLSLIELVVIASIMYTFSYISFMDKHNGVVVFIYGTIAFLISFGLINHKTVDMFDRACPIIASLFYIGFFATGFM